MLEDILNLRRRFAITRHREAPLLKEREKFLEHLHRQGTSLAALRSVSWQLLNVIAQLKLTQLRRISIGEIKEAGRAWAVQQRSNPRAHSYKESARSFTYVAQEVAAFFRRAHSTANAENAFCRAGWGLRAVDDRRTGNVAAVRTITLLESFFVSEMVL
jgi:hypothetical protein